MCILVLDEYGTGSIYNDLIIIIKNGDKDMSRKIVRDTDGALEGLPLHLLILVIVAAVGISIVLAWMAPLKAGIGASVGSVALTENGGCDKIVCTTQPDGTAVGSGYVVVTVKDLNGKPLVGADVEIRGCSIVDAKKTDTNGIADFGNLTVVLQPNTDIGYIQLNVKIPNSERQTTIIVKRA